MQNQIFVIVIVAVGVAFVTFMVLLAVLALFIEFKESEFVKEIVHKGRSYFIWPSTPKVTFQTVWHNSSTIAWRRPSLHPI